jgi:ADP-dependent phosphofructokinase/glucokinase
MLEHKHVFPRKLGKRARNRWILPNRNYLKQEEWKNSQNSIQEIHNSDKGVTLFTAFHAIFITNMDRDTCNAYFSHSQVSGISLRMVKMPKHVAFTFISHKDYLTCTD